MPRGKVFNQSPAVNALEDESFGNEAHNKHASTKFTLITPDSSDDVQEEDSAMVSAELAAQKTETNSMNFKFTVLLVTLFVAVNIGLVALLDNDKPEPQVAQPVTETKQVNLPVIKDNNVSHKSQQADSVSVVAKPEPVENSAVERPVLGKPAAPEQAEVETVEEKPVATVAEPVKRTSSGPVVREDLLSIIGKE